MNTYTSVNTNQDYSNLQTVLDTLLKCKCCPRSYQLTSLQIKSKDKPEDIYGPSISKMTRPHRSPPKLRPTFLSKFKIS